MIPKIIHQIYWDFSNNNKPIPEKWKEMSNILQKNHIDFEYKLWNDKTCFELLQNHYSWFLDVYNSYKDPIQKCDSIRPFILYHYGGIYLDMDVSCVKNIYEYIKNPGVYILQSSHHGLTNSLMGSTKNHAFWHIVMLELVKNEEKKWYHHISISNHWYIMQSTGPHLITRCSKKYKENDIYILPKNIFNPCNVCQKTCNINKNIYCYTINSRSWNKLDSVIINFIFCQYVNIFSVLILIGIFNLRLI